MTDSILAELAKMTPQRDFLELAKEADIVFSDKPINEWPAAKIETDPLKVALDYTRIQKGIALVVLDGYFFRVTHDASWMQVLRIYHLMQEQKWIQEIVK